MARIRTIKPEFWASEQVMELSMAARLAFIGLWSFCDDRGVHAASPKRLKAEVFPSDDLTSDGVASLMAELVHHGLVAEFESGGQQYWYVTGWAKHQRIDRPTYRHPEPPNSATPPRALDESSANDRRVLDGPSPPEWNGMEGNGDEQDQKRSSTAAPLTADPNAGKGDSEAARTASRQANAAARAARLAQVTRDAIETFNAHKLTKVNGGLVPNVDPDVGAEQRRQQVAKCVEVARSICKKDFDSDVIVRDFWVEYWDACLADEHKSGRAGGGKDHGNWLPTFEYLTRDATMLEVYDRLASAAAAATAGGGQ